MSDPNHPQMFDLNQIPYDARLRQYDLWIVYHQKWFSQPGFFAWLQYSFEVAMLAANLMLEFSNHEGTELYKGVLCDKVEVPAACAPVLTTLGTLLTLRREYRFYCARRDFFGSDVGAKMMFDLWHYGQVVPIRVLHSIFEGP